MSASTAYNRALRRHEAFLDRVLRMCGSEKQSAKRRRLCRRMKTTLKRLSREEDAAWRTLQRKYRKYRWFHQEV